MVLIVSPSPTSLYGNLDISCSSLAAPGLNTTAPGVPSPPPYSGGGGEMFPSPSRLNPPLPRKGISRVEPSPPRHLPGPPPPSRHSLRLTHTRECGSRFSARLLPRFGRRAR